MAILSLHQKASALCAALFFTLVGCGGQKTCPPGESGNSFYEPCRATETTGSGTNGSPSAIDDQTQTRKNTAVDIPVLYNDTDPQGAILTVSLVTQPQHGSVTINSNMTLHYTPNTDFFGADTLTYTVKNPGGLTDTATVIISVLEGTENRPPIAANDSVRTAPNVAIDIPVLANDSDPDSDALTIVSVTQPSKGSATPGASNVTFRPTAEPNPGSVTFTYTVSDGRGGSATGTVTAFIIEGPSSLAIPAGGASLSTVSDPRSAAYFIRDCQTGQILCNSGFKGLCGVQNLGTGVHQIGVFAQQGEGTSLSGVQLFINGQCVDPSGRPVPGLSISYSGGANTSLNTCTPVTSITCP